MMTFRREERLRGEALIERLFHREGSRSMAAFPLRMVYMKTASDGAGAAAGANKRAEEMPEACR